MQPPGLHLIVFIGIIGLGARSAYGNKLCPRDVWRCPYNQVCVQYNRKSECRQGTLGLDCRKAPKRGICLDLEKVCGKSRTNNSVVAPDASGGGYAADNMSMNAGSYGLYGSYNPYGSYAVDPSTSTSISATTALPSNDDADDTTPTDLCSSTNPSDGAACNQHTDCVAVPGGISLCCKFKCIQAHTLPFVASFFKQEDRLC